MFLAGDVHDVLADINAFARKTPEDIEALEEALSAQIQESVDRAEERMAELEGEALTMFEHIFAEMPPYLAEQRDELATFLTRNTEASDG